MWNYCGMGRTAEGLQTALKLIPELKAEFWANVRVLGSADDVNQELEKVGRVADYFELGELMCLDALQRNESCGGHFREEYQTEDGEARRDDDEYAYVGAWQYTGDDNVPLLHKEPLVFACAARSPKCTPHAARASTPALKYKSR
jgi:succinate dehydrogenase / fumarate reductase flavoprotein subunit